jgi:hypothetical protein
LLLLLLLLLLPSGHLCNALLLVGIGVGLVGDIDGLLWWPQLGLVGVLKRQPALLNARTVSRHPNKTRNVAVTTSQEYILLNNSSDDDDDDDDDDAFFMMMI